MKIGLISDIHGNLFALQAVLAQLDAAAVDLILCAGDLVCYGGNDNAVLTLLRERGIASVMGNYDDAVAWNRPKASRKPSSVRNEPLKQAALDWTKANLHSAHIPYLRSLPLTSLHRINGMRIRLLHAGPDFYDDWLTPKQPRALHGLTTRMQADIIILGHTHDAFSHEVSHTLFVNPGAVGRSLDGDPRASYAILDTQTGAATFFRHHYDLDATVSAIERSGMPNDIARLIRHGARRIEMLDKTLPHSNGQLAESSQ